MFKGWLDVPIYSTSIEKAWNGIKNAIDFDGTIDNIIGETGIHDNPEQYAPNSMFYEESAPGIGAVLRAVAAMAKFSNQVWNQVRDDGYLIWQIKI